jgi:hypothetical protein
MKYKIRTYDTSTNVALVAICGDIDSIEEARIWGVSLLFLDTAQEFEKKVSDLWTLYQIEQSARENINAELVSYILDNTGTEVELDNPAPAQASHSTAVDSTGTTGVEVL